MFKRSIFALIAFALALSGSVRGDENPTYNGPLSPSESAFVQSIATDLMARFPHAADAEKAGYIRYTNADSTGAISYANLQWTSADIAHPSQLWYDKDGNLLGADFSVPKTDARPVLFGVNPGRWYAFDDHVHYVLKDPVTGKMTYDGWMWPKKFKAMGGDPQHPSAAMIVRTGRAKTAAEVTSTFDFPSVWDLIVWVKPNPNGAFAEKNPLVTP